MSKTCWTVFVIMSAAFFPLYVNIHSLHAGPPAARMALAIGVVGVLWWAPFFYGMYLSLAVMRNGDRRLLKRGIAGTAEVLSAKGTNAVIQEGEFAWEAPRLYKYRLRVTIPGRAPYETECAICAVLSQGSVVNVAVSRHNRNRVTIDVGQGSKGGASVAGGAGRPGFPAGGPGRAAGPAVVGQARPVSEAQRIALLTQLAELRRQGILTDDQFADGNAQLLELKSSGWRLIQPTRADDPTAAWTAARRSP
jgi:hypothetical protein